MYVKEKIGFIIQIRLAVATGASEGGCIPAPLHCFHTLQGDCSVCRGDVVMMCRGDDVGMGVTGTRVRAAASLPRSKASIPCRAIARCAGVM